MPTPNDMPAKRTRVPALAGPAEPHVPSADATAWTRTIGLVLTGAGEAAIEHRRPTAPLLGRTG